jgi:hypothetical protein
MRHTGYVGYGFYLYVQTLQSADGCIAAKTNTPQENINLGHAMLLLNSVAGLFGGNLSGIGSTLLRTAETAAPSAGCCQNGAFRIGKADDRVVKRS